MPYKVSIKPRSERIAIIELRVNVSTRFGEEIYDFRGETYTPKVILLPNDIPIYRMGNCRAFSAQQTEIARKSLGKDYFEKGQESSEVQQIQHEILTKLSDPGIESVAQ